MKTVDAFLADWKVYGDDKEFIDALKDFQGDAYESGRLSSLPVQEEIENMRRDLKRERARLDWLLPRQHTHTTRESIDRELI